MKDKRIILMWLLPIAIILIFLAPYGIKGIQGWLNTEKIEDKQKEEKDNKDKKDKDKNNIKDDQKKPDPEPEPAKPVMKDYGQPYLELTTNDCVKVPAKSDFDYMKYVKTAQNGDKSDAMIQVGYNRIDTNADVGSILIVNYILEDKLTSEKTAKTLIVEITKEQQKKKTAEKQSTQSPQTTTTKSN